jgi:ACS family hexuronate transporter-like MFS transporter
MTPPDPPVSGWRWWVCGVLLLATTLNYMDRISLNQMSKEIKETVHADDLGYGILESGFQIAFGIGAILFGIIVDRFGVRLVYPIAVVGWSVAGFLTGFAGDYWTLFGCRVMLGLFEAGNWPCGIRTIRQVMAPSERSLGNAVFQSGTGLGAIVTPLVILLCLWLFKSNVLQLDLDGDGDDDISFWSFGGTDWQLPFRAIGAIGLGWVLLWWFTVPKRVLAHPVAPRHATREPFSAVFADRRFWVLVVLILGVNTSWHTFRVWLPLYLRENLGYSKDESLWFNTQYFIAADIGSWLIGLAVVGMVRAGVNLHTARVRTYAVGVLLALSAGLLPFVSREFIEPIIGVTGFASLGLFATYFALSQEVSGRHQGKVTGVLGAINSAWLAGMYWLQGWASKTAGLEARPWVLAFAAVPAALALLAVVWFWPKGETTRRDG